MPVIQIANSHGASESQVRTVFRQLFGNIFPKIHTLEFDENNVFFITLLIHFHQTTDEFNDFIHKLNTQGPQTIVSQKYTWIVSWY